MLDFSGYYNFINTLFCASLCSYKSERKKFEISYWKIFYCSINFILVPTLYIDDQKFLKTGVIITSGNLTLMVLLFQSFCQHAISTVLLLYKLLSVKDEVTYRNQYLKFEESFNESLHKRLIVPPSKRDYRTTLHFVNSVILFIFQLISLFIVMLQVVRDPSRGVLFILGYILNYFQVIASGNSFLDGVIQYKFMISCINETLLHNLNIIKFEVNSKSKPHCMITSCSISDNINKLQEFNSKIHFLFFELVNYESSTMIIVFCHKFLEIIIPFFYQFIIRYVYVEEYHNAPEFYVFALGYTLCNIISIVLYIVACEMIQQEVIIGEILFMCL
uniref:Gustatory receptor n=1 Tax=Lutzomyia longipalpis TaxID=7200 RepID=A0A7G3B7S1_LUTLO